MPNDQRQIACPARRWKGRNVIAASTLLCAALMMTATTGCVARPPSQSTAIAPNPAIVRLAGRHSVITINAGPGIPLYTVADESGRVLVADMTTADLKKSHPELYEQIFPLLCAQPDDSGITDSDSGIADW